MPVHLLIPAGLRHEWVMQLLVDADRMTTVVHCCEERERKDNELVLHVYPRGKVMDVNTALASNGGC